MTVTTLKTVAQPVFLKKKHELANLLKKLDSASEDAVDVIVNTMNSTDKSVTKAMKIDCAKAIVGLQIKTSETISKDELTRQIAEMKAKGMSTPLELAPGEKHKLPPRLDMMTIQSVD